MSRSQQNAKSASRSKSGVFATLANFLRGPGSGAPSLRLLTLVALALLSVALLASSAQAAEPSHPLVGPFGTAAQAIFGRPGGMAVDPSTGDLYVIDAPVPA